MSYDTVCHMIYIYISNILFNEFLIFTIPCSGSRSALALDDGVPVVLRGSSRAPPLHFLHELFRLR